MKFRLDPQLIGPLVALAIVTVIVALTSDRFLDPGNGGSARSDPRKAYEPTIRSTLAPRHADKLQPNTAMR